ncbi:BRO family protein [Pasteurella multocida]|uniref:BRO family protein n=2 Tax=Pasteurella multocida TaxID=747 RepID=UPI002A4FB760|nr:BRO family protein [Pasteurella multocida]MDY0489433.1 BRO family protein [Pasteurella multocida]MDY0595965.1 BRO family protein [Pasteurella multocida]MDY0665387.1 BRO family protein [Pasteurella multocida]
MSTQIQFQSFCFKSSQVRVITDPNQEFWFCGSDVCYILGYKNAPDALAKHCKQGGIAKRYTPTQSGEQEMIFINEPNLYRLIIKSRKPEAEPFETWVFEEVLPQIRKTGKYEVQSQQLALPEPEKKYTFSFTEYELQQLAWAWFAFSRCTETLRKLYSPLQKLGSHFAPKAYGQGMEYYRLVQSTNDTINRITKDFKCVSNNNWRVLEHVRNFDKNAIVYNQIHD